MSEVTGKLELAYSTYCSTYNYSLVLLIEMKSTMQNITIDSQTSHELQVWGEMAYCMKASNNPYALGFLYADEFIFAYLLLKEGGTYLLTKLKINDVIKIHIQLHLALNNTFVKPRILISVSSHLINRYLFYNLKTTTHGLCCCNINYSQNCR